MIRKYFSYIVLATFSIFGLATFILFYDEPVETKKDDEVVAPKIINNEEIDNPETEIIGPGEYTSYSFNKLSANKINVIFFAASWCPTCQELDSSLNNQLSEIPNNLQILKADYDKETNLRQQYGVTYQHTLVQVDQEGNKIKSWSGGYDLESILNQLN